MSDVLTSGSGPRENWRRAKVRTLVVMGMLVGGILSVRVLEAALHATFDKPRAELRKPLPLIPKQLGLSVRYVSTNPDEVLDPEVVETLGTTEYLVRQYQEKTVRPDQVGSLINLNVNYYGTGSSTPHVPEICWAGSGRKEVAGARCYFDVKGVKRHDGSQVDLRMKMISFVPPALEPTVDEKSGKPMYTNVAYVFQVNGQYVASTQEVTSQFWKASYRYAYHSKIEVTPLVPTDNSERKALTCTQEEAQKIVGAFIRESLSAIEACLPDPAILNPASATPAGGN